MLDGWSRAVFTTQLYNRYERLLSGRARSQRQPDWTYRDFVAQEQRVSADADAEHFFARDARRRPRAATAPAEGRRRRAVAGRALAVEAFHRRSPPPCGVGRQLGVPVQAVLLAGHFKVLVRAERAGARRQLRHSQRPGRRRRAASAASACTSTRCRCRWRSTPATWRELIGQVAGLQHGRDAVPRLPALEDPAGRGPLLRRGHFQLHPLPRLQGPRLRRQPRHSRCWAPPASSRRTSTSTSTSRAASTTTRCSMALIFDPEIFDGELMARLRATTCAPSS